MEVRGKYGTAIIYTDEVGEETIAQVIQLLNHPMAEGAHVSIMPDCHKGEGCVIGFTASITDKIVPNVIGVDIGCGVSSWVLTIKDGVDPNFSSLDRIIRTYVPYGKDVQRGKVKMKDIERIFNTLQSSFSFIDFSSEISRICKKTGQDEDRVWKAIGSLGDGNHFLEVNIDEEGTLYLVIHSGSRNFGYKIANYHQKEAEAETLTMPEAEYKVRLAHIRSTKKGKEIGKAVAKLNAQAKVRKHKRTGLEYLEGLKAEAYFRDMRIAQIYAQLNRRMMGEIILSRFADTSSRECLESVHNYVDFEDGIIRKGAISAQANVPVIIPLNMAEGSIIGIGKGNPDWNFSAPHGAGRKMSRSQAKKEVTIEEFQETMMNAGVWSTCVNVSTLDESPQAYKDSSTVLEYLQDSVDIVHRLKPIYNFKATE